MQQANVGQNIESLARRNSTSYWLSKTDQMYHKKDSSKIKMDEFSIDIEFKYGVPMIILDVIQAFTGFTINENLQRELSPPRIIERMNPDDDNFINYKSSLIEEFPDMAFSIFDSLGELDLLKIQDDINAKRNIEDQKLLEESQQNNKDSQTNIFPREMLMKERERIQFITISSIKRNFHKVFGKSNNGMAELLFKYTSDCRNEEEINNIRINYKTFLNKFDLIWPKKVVVQANPVKLDKQ